MLDVYTLLRSAIAVLFHLAFQQRNKQPRYTEELMISKNNKCVSSSRLDAHQSDALLRRASKKIKKEERTRADVYTAVNIMYSIYI